MKIHFKKKINQKIFLSDNRFKYQLDNPYWSWNEKEVPTDSMILRQQLGNRNIVVINITGGNGIVSGFDFNKYLVEDKQFEDNIIKKEEELKERIIKKEKVAKENKKIEKKKKEQKELKKKKDDEKKNKVEVLEDFDILNKL